MSDYETSWNILEDYAKRLGHMFYEIVEDDTEFIKGLTLIFYFNETKEEELFRCSIDTEKPIKSFADVVQYLQQGISMEQLTKGWDVECYENTVYDDSDWHAFLHFTRTRVKTVNDEYTVFVCEDTEYEVPFEMRENRFSSDLPNEMVLMFDKIKLKEIK